MDDYLSRLSAFVADTPGEAIPADVRARASLIIADCVGCMAGGTLAPEVERLSAQRARRDAAASASVPGLARRFAPEDAGFLGGVAGTWHDLDEGNLHTRTHAAIQILPAALAEAESRDLRGRMLVDAFVLAYEAAARLWRATSARLAVHPHGTYGPLAAAAALCRLRGDSPGRTRDALNIAMTLGLAASRQALADGATVRNIYTGHSARAGFEALGLRDLGFTGEHDAPASVLGHIYGDRLDTAAAAADLGERWWIRTSYFKRFASGRYMHGALDALEALQASSQTPLDPARIQRIDVDTFFMAATMHGQSVRTPFGMRFSIPAALARVILHGTPSLTDDGASAFADGDVHALARRVFVREAPECTAAYPDRQPTRLRVTFIDGQVAESSCERILGESDHPLPQGALQAKFKTLTADTLGAAGEDAWATLTALDDAPSVADVCARLRGAEHRNRAPA